MWIEFLRQFGDELEFHAPASAFSLDDAEAKLGLTLPEQLREVLRESNGVEGTYGLGLLWPIERIVNDNLMFRSNLGFRNLYMPFDHLLFVADAGNGDQFAFPIDADGIIHRDDIFAWDHESDSRAWVAPSLRTYFEWWSTGKIVL
jgi:hypothetical protein